MFLRTMCSTMCPRVLSRLAFGLGRSVHEPASLIRGLHFISPPARLSAEAARRLGGVRPMSQLIDALKDEISYEKENYEISADMEAPKHFKLVENPGDTHMILTRELDGEKITIDVMVNGQEDTNEEMDEDTAEDDVDVGVLFTVQVAKGEQALLFECKSDGTYLQIQHCSLEPASGEYEESMYTGPVFMELDDRLQQEFQTYLEERGINAEIGGYLLRLVHDKEQREYMSWLENVSKFISKK